MDIQQQSDANTDWLPLALKAHADKDARLVEIATLQVLMTTTAKISHINYFRPAIEEMCGKVDTARDKFGKPSDNAISAILERRRLQYAQ